MTTASGCLYGQNGLCCARKEDLYLFVPSGYRRALERRALSLYSIQQHLFSSRTRKLGTRNQNAEGFVLDTDVH